MKAIFIFVFFAIYPAQSQIFDFEERCLDEIFILNFTGDYNQNPDEYIYGKYCTQKKLVSFRLGIGSTYQMLNGSFGKWYDNSFNVIFFLTTYYKKWLLNLEVEGLYTDSFKTSTSTLVLEPLDYEIGNMNSNLSFGRLFEFNRNYLFETFVGLNLRTVDFSNNQNIDAVYNGKIRHYTPMFGARCNKFWQFRNGNLGVHITFKYIPSPFSTINNQLFSGDIFSFGLGISSIGFFEKKRYKRISHEE